MATAESITVSLEWAKQLKAAGWPHGGYFAWYIYPDLPPDQREPGVPEPHEEVEKHYDKGWKVKLEHYRAPTAEEILKSLPHVYQSMVLAKVDSGKWRLMPMDAVNNANTKIGDIRMDTFDHDTIADTAAALWCYLSENNLLPASPSL